MSDSGRSSSELHKPVLFDEVVGVLKPQPGETYLDVTAGYGGHAAAILKVTRQAAVLVDRDENAAEVLKSKFPDPQIEIINSDFYAASRRLLDQGRQFQMILADLGVSSPHLDTPERGFSFARDGPLDMRMDRRQKLTAATIVNEYDEAAIAEILRQYGEEPRARRIAGLIADHRPFASTAQLAEVVARAWPGRRSKVHPATRTFQALRIAVNQELEMLRKALPIWLELLAPAGRLAIISFHSLEDRIVKRFLSEQAGDRYDASLRLLTRQPLTAGPEELVNNPRARSAKLRAAVKIKTKGKGD